MKNKKTKPMARTYYVAIVSYGEYEDNDKYFKYVGENYERAKEVIEKFKFPDPEWNKAWIEHWQNGKEIKSEWIIE